MLFHWMRSDNSGAITWRTEDSNAAAVIKPMLDQITAMLVPSADADHAVISPEMGMAMIRYMPMRGMMSFGGIQKEELSKVVEKLNQ